MAQNSDDDTLQGPSGKHLARAIKYVTAAQREGRPVPPRLAPLYIRLTKSMKTTAQIAAEICKAIDEGIS